MLYDEIGLPVTKLAGNTGSDFEEKRNEHSGQPFIP
jgi:hypothetical protein